MRKNEKTQSLFKKVIEAWPIIVALSSIIFFIFGYILSIRSDLNATELQVQAMQQSIAPLESLVPQVAAIKQFSQDTNDKVNFLYSRVK